MSNQLTTAPQPDAVELGDVILTLDEQIDYAEWQVVCAQAHLDDLRAKKAALENEQIEMQYQEYLDIEFGEVCIESDAHDEAIAEVMQNA